MVRPNRGLLVIAIAVAMLVFIRGDRPAYLQEPTTQVGYLEVESALQEVDEVRVMVVLQELDMPFAEQTLDIVKDHTRELQTDVLSILTPVDFEVLHQFRISPAVAGMVTKSGLTKLGAHPDVIAIELLGGGEPHLTESVPLIHANDVHSASVLGSGSSVAVLDSGIDTDHPNLLNNIADEQCFLVPSSIFCGPPLHPAEDDLGHGTQVTGVIASYQTPLGLTGVAPSASIYAYKVIPGPGTGLQPTAVLAALEYIEDIHVPVDSVNMSFSIFSVMNDPFVTCDTNETGDLIKNQIDRLFIFEGVVAFSSSGNSAIKTGMLFPACYGQVLSVGAVYDADIGSYTWAINCRNPTTQPDKVACASDSSNQLDLLAPGCEIETTNYLGGYSQHCGTSLAVAHAVGVASLLKGLRPSLLPWQVWDRLVSTGKWVFDPVPLRWTPRIDARVALPALANNDNGDWDGDGCRNGSEYTLNVPAGAYRNPLDSEDYYDVSIPKDGVIDLSNDILGVIDHYSPVGAPPYDVYYDRGPSIGPFFYNHGPRDGVIDLSNDILSVINQYNPGGC